MISLKVLSTVAAMALLVPVLAPSESFAQAIGRSGKGGGGGGAGVVRGPGGGGGGGFIPGAVAGALIGGALVGGYGYGPGYYAPGYYDDQYYDDGAVAVAPAGDDAVAYCMQTYRSYDPRSGTYLGNDGYRHPCP